MATAAAVESAVAEFAAAEFAAAGFAAVEFAAAGFVVAVALLAHFSKPAHCVNRVRSMYRFPVWRCTGRKTKKIHFN